MHEPVYDVFARKSRGEALRHVGYLHALDHEMARVYAWKTYDEENWFEMCIVPRAAIIPVNRDEGPFAAARRADHPTGGDEDVPAAQPYGGDA